MKPVPLIHRMAWIAVLLIVSIPTAQMPGTVQAQSAGDVRPQSLADLKEAPTLGVDIPANLGAQAVKRATAGGLPVESRGNWGMSPHATPEQVKAALAMAQIPDVPGPVEETWQSVHDNYRIPDWMVNGKLGIFIHFGLYSIPAHGSEWYEKHMYSNAAIRNWHIEHFGPLDQFGVTNHTIEHYDFIEPRNIPAGMKNDLNRPGYEDFYWVNHSDERLSQFMAQWLAKHIELIDQYQPGAGPHVLRIAGLHIP